MAVSYNKKQFYKTVASTCYGANILYLFLHVFYLVLFIVSKAYALIYIDAAIIAIYALLFLLIKKRKYYLYALICGNVFFAFIIASTIMLGFNTGFHFYLISLCVISFFTSYFSKVKTFKGSLIWVGLSLTIYLTLYFVTEYNSPLYSIDKWLTRTLFTTHSILVFLFIAGYLMVFIRYAFSLEKKIMNESRTDELTKIGNRYSLYDYFEQVKDKSSLVLALFDIDDFKNINDTYGHVAGDYILKRVAEISTTTLEDAFVCRYGGEEFVAVFSSEDPNYLFEKMENLRKSIKEALFEFNGTKIDVTITIGATNYVDDISLEKWVELADAKMYFGKNSGKNKTVI